MNTVVSEISPDKLREALGCFATGVAIVTGVHPETGPVGLTISSFNSLSLDPPLILWSLSRGSGSLSAFAEGRSFVVNILSEAQHATCLQFARSGTDKFRDVSVTPGLSSVPMIDGSVAQLQCTVEQSIPEG
ncbi:MAG: flavin reductase family protein [Roseovarius sp.]|nr:flavin reductase family protein [Roseovarius sp.]